MKAYDGKDFSSLSIDQKVAMAFQIHKVKEHLSREELELVSKRLERLEASDCLILDIVHSLRESAYGGSVFQQFKDRLENQERILQTVVKELQQAVGNATEPLQREVFKLAKKIAGTENSESFVAERVLPFVRQELKNQQQEINEAQAAVRLVKLMYEKEFGSLCDRVKQHSTLLEDHESRISLLEQNSGGNRVASKPVIEANAIEWSSINRTEWEPQGYATHKELCANPKPGPQNVYFDTIIRTNRGWVPHRYFGDIWIDCSKRVVMVLRNPN
ncbi:MAG: hypothetical protein SFV81_06295 [Pirellulaceae bacterium]|nr:hypothetical protein [Pirellulaceae bacterium]